MRQNILKYALLSAGALMLGSCSIFDFDNYDEPDATISGRIVTTDGEPIQVEYGGGARIKLLDYGYSDNPVEQYLNVKSDGTFINKKMFASTYNIVAEGPFVPLIQVDEQSNIISDESLKGVGPKQLENLEFRVEPYFKLEWVGEPQLNGDRSITVSFTLERGTDNVNYHKAVQDIWLFINTVQYVGASGYDKFASVKIEAQAANDILTAGTATITSKVDPAHLLELGRPYYIRVGARMDYTGIWGANNYNYTTVKKIVLPSE